jgi:uncharacterized protein with ParB-like and HNH nuclease domain
MLNANKIKLEDLLSKQVKYSVPNYQRNFEWRKDNADEFWQDIQTPGTFMGTIVLNVSKEETAQDIDIVDGQQRFTTIFILLSALRNRAKEVGNINQAQAIQRFLSFVDNTDGTAGITKFIASDSIRFAFEETIINPNWDGSFSSQSLKNKRREVNKIKPIYNFFYEKISSYGADDIKNTLSSLYSSVFVSIQIQNTEEAFEIFERTNARGMDLNAADLLKNFLFSQFEMEDVEERWSNVVDGASSGGILRMIKYFYVSKKGYVGKKELFSKLKKYGAMEIGVNKFLDEIERFSSLYSLIIEKGADDFIQFGADYKIKYFQTEYNAHAINRALDAINLFGVTQSYPLILKCLDALAVTKNAKDREVFSKDIYRLVQIIENYHFVNSAVSKRPGNEVEKFYSVMCEGDISSENIKEVISKVKKQFNERKVGISEFVERFKELTYQNDYKLIFYINDRLNNYKRKGAQIIDMYDSDSKALRRSFDMEHLVSQNASEYDIDKDRYEEIVHNIGNMIVISKHTNGGIGNKHVEEKLPIIEEKDSRLPEVSRLVSQWKNANWNTVEDIEKNISDRAIELAERSFKEVWVI